MSSEKERQEFIKANDHLWGELKQWLSTLSFNKCWYSEAKEIYSHYHVDHFRPKNKYWWLAFDWKNYRLSGSVGNVHKSNNFPLKSRSPEAIDPDCDICDELPYLLDPTNPADPPLMTFDESGFVQPITDEGTWQYDRVKKTVELLHLHYRPLVDGRKIIWTDCLLTIRAAQNLMDSGNAFGSSKNTMLEQTFLRLRQMVSPQAELSAVAKACLLSSGIGWARNLVLS